MAQYILKSDLVAWAKETYLCENASMIRKVCYKQLLEHLDTIEVKEVQEEPVSIDFEQELYKAFGQVKDFTLGMRIAKWFYDMGKNSQELVGDVWHDASEPVVGNNPKLILYNPKYNWIDVHAYSKCKNHINESKCKWAYAKDLINLSNVERTGKNSQEPVSEDLEEALKCKVRAIFDSLEKFDVNDKEKNRVAFGLIELEAYAKMFCNIGKQAGAQWQKEQFENNRLKHCDSITNEQAELEQGFIDQHLDKHQRMPTFLDAIEYGMNLQKEQMIKNAVDGVVAASAGGDGWVNIATGFVKSEDVNVKFGDKIKIIVVKED